MHARRRLVLKSAALPRACSGASRKMPSRRAATCCCASNSMAGPTSPMSAAAADPDRTAAAGSRHGTENHARYIPYRRSDDHCRLQASIGGGWPFALTASTCSAIRGRLFRRQLFPVDQSDIAFPHDGCRGARRARPASRAARHRLSIHHIAPNRADRDSHAAELATRWKASVGIIIPDRAAFEPGWRERRSWRPKHDRTVCSRPVADRRRQRCLAVAGQFARSRPPCLSASANKRYWLASITTAGIPVRNGRGHRHVAGGTKNHSRRARRIMLPTCAAGHCREFGTLAALFPGRNRSRLGWAPGTDINTRRALRRQSRGRRRQFPAGMSSS